VEIVYGVELTGRTLRDYLRMLSLISSAVICSTMRAFSSFPPSIARTRASK